MIDVKVEIQNDVWLASKIAEDFEEGRLSPLIVRLLKDHYRRDDEQKVRYVTDMDGTRTPYVEP